MSEQEQCTPVWHAIVGEGYEPVQIGEIARSDDDVLRADGWVRAYVDGGLTYREDWKPRRRRKQTEIRLAVTGEENGLPYSHVYTVKPGELFTINDAGFLVMSQPAEGQVER
jgi:hypothetical protein